MLKYTQVQIIEALPKVCFKWRIKCDMIIKKARGGGYEKRNMLFHGTQKNLDAG